MKRATPKQKCRLCGKTAKLENSHIVPKWIIRRAKGPSNDPLLYSPPGQDKFHRSDKQQTAKMLGRKCEEKFSKIEKRVGGFALQKDGSFPLVENCSDPLASDSVCILQIDDTEAKNLVYFAVSVVWRAAVECTLALETAARFLPKRKQRQRDIDLGSYEDVLKAYLLGDSDLPQDVVVNVEAVAVSLTKDSRRVAASPRTHSWLNSQRRTHFFFGAGFVFTIDTGVSDLPGTILSGCLSQREPARITMRYEKDIEYWIETVISCGHMLDRE